MVADVCPQCNEEFTLFFMNGIKKSRFCNKCLNEQRYAKNLMKQGGKKKKVKFVNSTTKNTNSELDTLWSKAARKYYKGKCEICGIKRELNAHHIIGRSNMAVRWDIENCSLVCSTHHIISSKLSAHKTILDFIEAITKRRGEEWYTRLTDKAISIDKVNRGVVKRKLKSILNI